MNFSLSNLSRSALLEREAGVAPAVQSGMRDLLRDAALLVAMQAVRGQTEDYELLRDRCRVLVQQFGAALDRRLYASDVREDAAEALCALIDESSLRHLDASKRAKWSGQPLQVELFQKHTGGEHVFERLDARMRESSPNIDLLECYASVLGLGFKGKYAVAGESERQALITKLNAMLERLRPRTERPFLIEANARRIGDRLRNLSPWAFAGAACCIALAVWLSWHIALDAQLVALKSHAASQAAVS